MGYFFAGWMQMIIRYKPKNDHIKIVPLIPVDDAGRKVKLSGTKSQIQLLPGVNEVTDDEWIVIKPYLQSMIGKEVFAVEKEAPKSKRAPEGKAKNIIEMPVKEAVAYAQECVNPETLKKWYQEETREEVRIIIVQKMEELKIEVPKVDPDKIGGQDTVGDTGSDGSAGSEGKGNTQKALEDMTVEELRAIAAEKGITVTGNKAEILKAVKAAVH
jgi:hypothetical protein